LNATIPPDGIKQGIRSFSRLFNPSGVVIHSSGMVYIASFSCHWVNKWTPNATNRTLITGSPTGNLASDSQSLALDEPNFFLYVADRYDHPTQRFALGSPVGITVAGNNTQRFAANQLHFPSDIYL